MNEENPPSAEEASNSGSGEDDTVEKLQAEIAELKDRNLRTLAEFDNFKKRSLKERSELLKYQGEQVFKDLLEVVDNFERALKFSDADTVQFRDGIQMIYRGFTQILERNEVKSESSIGKLFDPTIHAAISKVPMPGKANDEIVDELKKPYFYKDKLIRFGEVVVAVDPEESV